MTTRLFAPRARFFSALATLLVAAIALFSPSVASAQLKLAVIDLRRAVADTEDGLRMKSKLQELFDSRQSEYDTKEKEYAKAKDELERLAKDGKTPETELRKKYALLEKQALELQAQGMSFRREMTQRENDLMVPILNKLNALVRQLAAQESYDMVINREAVPYFRGDLEITDRIIQMYNAATPTPADDKKSKDKKDKPATPDAAPAKADKKPTK